MPAVNTPRSATALASRTSARWPRSAPSATPTTTPWPKQSTATTQAELIRGPARPGPWKTVEDVELATLGWVHWHNHNHNRLHGYLADIPPAEFEETFYAKKRTDQTLVETNSPSLHQSQSDSHIRQTRSRTCQLVTVRRD